MPTANIVNATPRLTLTGRTLPIRTPEPQGQREQLQGPRQSPLHVVFHWVTSYDTTTCVVTLRTVGELLHPATSCAYTMSCKQKNTLPQDDGRHQTHAAKHKQTVRKRARRVGHNSGSFAQKRGHFVTTSSKEKRGSGRGGHDHEGTRPRGRYGKGRAPVRQG